MERNLSKMQEIASRQERIEFLLTIDTEEAYQEMLTLEETAFNEYEESIRNYEYLRRIH